MRSTTLSFSRAPRRWLGALCLLLAGTAGACEMPPPEYPGALYACPMDGGGAAAYCPLEHTDVRAQLSGDIARVTVTQRFRNPLQVPIEATYTFPLSEKSAVDRMQMKIGERIIVGTVKEKKEARAAYEAAKNSGRTAALLDQERPNIFTQSVANIQPGEAIEVTLSYVEYLKHEADEVSFAFPMTVGPRYIPGGALPGGGTTQVPDANKIAPPLTPEGKRAGHDVSLEVLVDAGMPLGEVTSELHKVEIERPSESRAIVRLSNQKEIPNRDFILKYTLRGGGIREGLLTHQDERGGFFTLWLQPPAEAAPREAIAKELVFVIDCSGSMSGFPIEKAKDTMSRCIQDLSERDTFNLISFSGGTGFCFPQSVAASAANKQQALAYLGQLHGGGGTEMMKAVQAALAGPYAKDRLRTVCFMTDGFIGNDFEILGAIQRGAAYARVFAFGIGSSVNRFLIEGMAREGRGDAQIVTLEGDGAAAAKRFSERIKRPVLTNIALDFSGLDGVELAKPSEQQVDLFAGQPLRISGRYAHAGDGYVTVRGETAEGPFERRVAVSLPDGDTGHDALASLWARERVEALMAQDWQGVQEGRPRPEIKTQITDLGTRYSLVTQYTSFVAVDESRRGANGQPLTLNTAVEMPDGVSYENIAPGLVAGAAVQQLHSLGYLPTTNAPVKATRRGMASIAPATPAPASRDERADGVAAAEIKTKHADKDAPKEEAEPMTKKADAATAAKLHAALIGLAGKLKNGNYEGEGLHVAAMRLEVAIYLTDTSEATLTTLRAAGVAVRSVSHAGGKVLAEISVTELEKIAALTYVVRITPPGV